MLQLQSILVLDSFRLLGESCVLFAPAYRLVQELLAAKRDLDLPRRLRKLDNFDFLLLDDLGYLPQGAEDSEVLFTLYRLLLRTEVIGNNLNPGLLRVGAHTHCLNEKVAF